MLDQAQGRSVKRRAAAALLGVILRDRRLVGSGSGVHGYQPVAGIFNVRRIG